MFGLAATSSRIAHNLGTTTAAAAVHAGSRCSSSPEHLLLISKVSALNTVQQQRYTTTAPAAAAANLTHAFALKRSPCVLCPPFCNLRRPRDFNQANNIPKGNLVYILVCAIQHSCVCILQRGGCLSGVCNVPHFFHVRHDGGSVHIFIVFAGVFFFC